MQTMVWMSSVVMALYPMWMSADGTYTGPHHAIRPQRVRVRRVRGVTISTPCPPPWGSSRTARRIWHLGFIAGMILGYFVTMG